MGRIYSVHVKDGNHGKAEVGLATVHLEDIITWMWGKDSALYLMALEDIEYDLECDGNVEEKIRYIVDFHDAFYADEDRHTNS